MSIAPIIVSRSIESPGVLTNNHRLIESLRSALSSGEHAFEMVPVVTEEILEEKAWRDCIDRNGQRHTFGESDFIDFVTSPSPRGLGTTLDEVRRYLGGSENPLRVMFERQTEKSQGGANNPLGLGGKTHKSIVNPNSIRVDNHGDDSPATLPISQGTPRGRDRSSEPQAGTSVGYAVRRLGRERPDLLAKVESGELSANAAALEAGFRKPSITLPVEPEAAVRLIVKHFKGDALYELIRGLVNWSGADIDTNPEQESR